MKVAIITFPGSNCDHDIGAVVKNKYHAKLDYIWHKDSFEPIYDLVVLPGGFSYGDYLRSGALAHFSPAVQALKRHHATGRKVLGICNGFQILAESGLLPGALTINLNMKYICKPVKLKKGSANNPLTKGINADKEIEIPIAHGEGRYFADEDTLNSLEDENRIFVKYSGENPNGSVRNIAGITSKDFLIAGLMPHPERAMDDIIHNTDGKFILDPFLS
ncbi:MAG: phosphoribosylformylglycinamidine synthase subunit PurQ [Leptospiraceae bacterium]|nr:phosphoribosylformylglycinamidine synthase subunit PurQ [Leptospiraceae bacterium]MCP5501493.1 phosphoribosylformylglycinamidine synthase subunit PurQ [Leptospiraceae bacterium]